VKDAFSLAQHIDLTDSTTNHKHFNSESKGPSTIKKIPTNTGKARKRKFIEKVGIIKSSMMFE
jgi:hypothetical protein